MLLTSVIEAVAYGYVFYRTKSLIATIVAHAIVNFPVRGVGDVVLAVLVLAIIGLARKPILAEIRAFWAMLRSDITSWVVTLLGVIGVTLFMIAYALAGDTLVLVGVAQLVIALILEFVEKRSLHPHTPAYSAPVG